MNGISVEAWVTLIILAIVLIAIYYIVSIWIYKRAPANMAFIRTGFLGTKVCLGRGAIVLPVFHEVTWVSLETIKLIVSRSRDQAILTQDKIRIDVVAELYTHVGHSTDEILRASRSLGEKTFDADKVRNLLEAKVVSALRSHAATKTLSELHENRDAFATAMKADIKESFLANGLSLEEVTIVTLEQTGKEYFKADNVFDAEGLKIITEITSAARREVHNTEKRTTVAIRQRDLDTQLELLGIEQQEAFARANQDKAIANEQAQQLGQKQIYILEQRLAVEAKEIDNEQALERMKTERDVAITEEHRRREIAEIQKALALEKAQKDRQIELIGKAKDEELTNISRQLALEQAEKDRQIGVIAKERERQQAEIDRATKVTAHEELARDARHKVAEDIARAIRKRSVETRLTMLDLDKEEAIAAAHQEKEVAEERARVLAEQQRLILEERWKVQQEEIAKEEQVNRARVKQVLGVEIEEKERELALIAKEQERERADIRRFLAREKEERDRQIALADKTRELEQAEIKRLGVTAQREKAEHDAESVRLVADAERKKVLEQREAEAIAAARSIDEENKAQISSMHLVTAAEARRAAAGKEAEATLVRARSTSEAQQVSALGIEREAGAKGRAEMEIEALRAANHQRMLEAEALGMEAKAQALKKYNDAAAFLELARLHIEAERDIHIDQAKAMGNALSQAQIRMYGGDNEGTVNTIRGMFTKGFGLGEALEGIAQSLPQGLRERFAQNGLRGIFGKPMGNGNLKDAIDRLTDLVGRSLKTKQAKEVPFPEGLSQLESNAGKDANLEQALGLLREINQNGLFNDVPFEKVWSLVQAAAKASPQG